MLKKKPALPMLVIRTLVVINYMYKLTLKLTIGRVKLPSEAQSKRDVYSDVQMKEESTNYPRGISSHFSTIASVVRDVGMIGGTLYTILHQHLL